jgi:putative endonuclease
MPQATLGKLGESLARQFLENAGYRVLTQNYRSPYGEIDLIVADPTASQNTLVFVEVKTRTSRRFGAPIHAVDFKKRQHLRLTAQHWLTNLQDEEPLYRFDVVEVMMGSDGLAQIAHHKAIEIEVE